MTSVLMSTITRPYETKMRGSSTSCTSGLTNVVRSAKTPLMISQDRTGKSPLKNTCGTISTVRNRQSALTSQRTSTGRTRK